MHLQPVFADAPCVGGAVAEDLFDRGVCLPSGSGMTDEDLERVIAAVRGDGWVPDGVSTAKVLWVAKGLGPGGMEQLLVNHATVGDRERIEYSAAYVVERPNSIVPRLEALGVPCHRLGGADPRDPRWVARLARLVRDERIDVVHVHSPYIAALARPALRVLPHRPAVIYTEHNSADCYGRATRWANLTTYPLDDARFAVSAAARDSTPSGLRGRTEVLVHGVDVTAIAEQRRLRSAARDRLGIEDGQLLVGIVANLRAAKAYPVLLDAAARVVRDDPRVRFVSMGQGPLEAELHTRTRTRSAWVIGSGSWGSPPNRRS